MNIPGISLNGEQQARLDALIMHGNPELVIHDTVVNGSPLYVLAARGDARKFVMAAVESTTVEAIEAADDQDAAVLEPRPPKPVRVRDGVISAEPGAAKAN